MDADYTFYVKSIETHVRAFLPLNISAVSSVTVGKSKVEISQNFKAFSEYTNFTNT